MSAFDEHVYRDSKATAITLPRIILTAPVLGLFQ